MPYTGGFPELGKEGKGAGGLQAVRGAYDFAVDGGAVGAVDLTRDAQIPAGAVILGGFIDVSTAVASATGTVAIAAEGAADILAATGQAGLTLGRKSIIPAFTGASAVKTTAARKLVATIATAVLTAGKFDVVIFYVKLY
jgi:hypothetical protein